MQTTIKYSIQFYSYWHCGSGLAAGASADALVVKDAYGLPFVPGKTIKGLLREVVEEYSGIEQGDIDTMFGKRADKDNETTAQGACFFSNACLREEERNLIITKKWQKHLYDTIASTAIDEDTQTAKENSLRTIEVAVPCTMHGQISGVTDNCAEKMKQALRMIKRIGVNRNRGLGRCDFKITEEEGGER